MAQQNNTLIIAVVLIVALAFYYINKGMVKYGTRKKDDSNSKGESTSSGCPGCGGKFLLGILFAIVAFIGILIIGKDSGELALCHKITDIKDARKLISKGGWVPYV